jgi:hypothetical protein
MLLGMTAKANECEKPPFGAPFETPFDPLRVSLGKQGKQNKQGPATSFVVACAFAPVAGALGYKGPSLRGSQPPYGGKQEAWGTRKGKSPRKWAAVIFRLKADPSLVRPKGGLARDDNFFWISTNG